MVNPGNTILDCNITGLTVKTGLFSGIGSLNHLHFTHIGLNVDLFFTRFQCFFGFIVVVVTSLWFQWRKTEFLSLIVLFSKTVAALSSFGFGCVLFLVPCPSEIGIFLLHGVSCNVNE